MKIQSIILAAAAAVALAAPAAAFAEPWHGSGDSRGYGHDEGRGSGHDDGYGYGYGYGRDSGRHDRDGGRRIHCRRGVFYMRGNACSNDYGRDRDGWRGHDRNSRDDGSDHRRWR